MTFLEDYSLDALLGPGARKSTALQQTPAPFSAEVTLGHRSALKEPSETLRKSHGSRKHSKADKMKDPKVKRKRSKSSASVRHPPDAQTQQPTVPTDEGLAGPSSSVQATDQHHGPPGHVSVPSQSHDADSHAEKAPYDVVVHTEVADAGVVANASSTAALPLYAEAGPSRSSSTAGMGAVPAGPPPAEDATQLRRQTSRECLLPFAIRQQSRLSTGEEPSLDERKPLLPPGDARSESKSPPPTVLRKSVGVSTEMQVSETTVELDVNPYVRYPLVSLNIIFWLMGLLLILAGLYAYIDTWNQSQYSAFSSSQNIYSVVMVRLEITVMLLGVTLLSLSFCGCVGALRENTCLLNTYSYFITALLLINLVLGLLVFFLPTEVKRLLRRTFTQDMVIHYRDNPDFQQVIDNMQEFLHCCGLSEKAFRDWNDNIYFNCSRTNPSHERCSVPYSCCKRNETDAVLSLYCGHGVLNKTDYDAWFRIYTGNCLDAAHRYIRENVTLITGLCLVVVILLAFVQMVTQALIDEILIIRKIYDKFYDRVQDIRAAQELSD